MKSIFAVEYYCNRNMIRTLGQIEMEYVVMKENTTRFKIAYNSALLHKSNLDKVGTFCQNKGVQTLL